MSTQRRSDFCLRCISSESDCAIINQPPGLPLCGQSPFTLAVSFYPKYIHGSGILVKQKGGFVLGYEDGSVYFAIHGQNAYTSCKAGTLLCENAWNSVAVVYSCGKLKMFVNNVSVLDGEAANENPGQSGEPYKAGIFDGYLRNVQLLDFAVDQETVSLLPFIQLFTDKKALLNVDFEAYIPVDDGEAKANIQLTGQCDTVNIVQALCPGRWGFAALRSKINPGGFAAGAFTIIAKIYATEETGYGVIFANGEAEEEDSVALCIENLCPVFVLGNQSFTFNDKISVDQWRDLAVTLDQGKMALYIDGKPAGEYKLEAAFQRKSRAELLIGNRYINGETANGFTGYIDGVAVFDTALGQAKIEDYANIPPYYYDAHLCLLCIFSENGLRELKSGASYSFGGDADVSFRYNTIRERAILPMAFHMDREEDGSGLDEITKWKLTMVARTMLTTANRLQEPSDAEPFDASKEMNPVVLKKLHQKIGETEEFKQLSEDKETYSPEKMGAIIGASGLVFTSILMCPSIIYNRLPNPDRGLTDVPLETFEEETARRTVPRRAPGQRTARNIQYNNPGAGGAAGGGTAAGGAGGGAAAGGGGAAAAGGAAGGGTAEGASIASGIAMIIAVFAGASQSTIKEKEKEEQKGPQEETNIKVEMPAPAALKSVSFYRDGAESQGMLPPAADYGTDKAEWSDKSEHYPILYCQNGASQSSEISIIANFLMPVEKYSQVIGVSVKETTIGCCVFGEGQSAGITPQTDGFSAKISFGSPKLSLIEPGEYQVRLTWSLMLKDGKKESLGTTSHTVRKISVKLESVSFYHEAEQKAGALFALPDFDSEPILPEWKYGRDPGCVLYHKQGQGNPHILAEVTIHGLQDASILCVLKAENQGDCVLGTPDMAGQSVGQGTAEMWCELKEHQLLSAGAGQYETRWDWKISINGSQNIGLETTKLETHILNGPPLLPWSLDEKKGLLPIYPVIKQCEEVLKIQSDKASPEDERYADQFVRWAFESGKLKEAPKADMEQFTKWDRYGYNLSLDAKRIAACLSGERQVMLGNQDICSLMLLWARLQGFDKLDMLKLSVADDYDLLFLNKVIPLGGNGEAKEVIKKAHYCIVKNNDQEFYKSLIWDGYYALPSSPQRTLISAMPFSQYKEKSCFVRKSENSQCYFESLFRYGSRCYVHVCIHRIFIESFNPLLRAIRPGREGEPECLYHVNSKRNFDDLIKEVYNLRPYQERCHCLSYNSMEGIIIYLINQTLRAETYTFDGFIDKLNYLTEAVYLTSESYILYDPPLGLRDHSILQREMAFVEQDRLIDAVSYMLEKGQLSVDDRDELSAVANDYLCALNNSITNLRIGLSDWNHSIQEFYDPIEWLHISPDGLDANSHRILATQNPDRVLATQKQMQVELDNALEKIKQVLDSLQLPNEGLPLISNVGFYLVDARDNIRMTYLKKQDDDIFSQFINIKRAKLTILLKNRDNEVVGISDNSPRILYSSNNKWDLSLYERGSNDEPIYYYDVEKGAWMQV